MPSYPEQQILRFLELVGKAEVLNDLHLVRVNNAGARTQPVATTCKSLGLQDRALLGDQLPAPLTLYALCRHMRRIIPPELIP
jgi:hypothetical protein